LNAALFIIREEWPPRARGCGKDAWCVEKGDLAGALALGKKSNDSIARILVYSLNNKEYSPRGTLSSGLPAGEPARDFAGTVRLGERTS